MTTAYVRRDIAASPDTIWNILTDATRLSDGSFSILRIEGQIVLGQKIKLWSEVDPKRAFPIKVAVKTPDRMEWHGGMPLGLFTGKRHFTLIPSDDITTFEMQESYHGPLSGLMTKLIPDLQPSFEKFGNALKATAEANE